MMALRGSTYKISFQTEQAATFLLSPFLQSDSEFINVYSAYMNEFKVAMQTLARYEQGSPKFKEELQSCQQKHECEGLSLAAFLLTPIQRLPRYEMLLKVRGNEGVN